MSPKISIAIITYNEEQNIRRTLESVRWADEIVVVDSGSTDKTVEICQEYTDKIIYQEWLGFSSQKNLAIDNAKGEWVLSLDADEPVEPELSDEIRRIVVSPESCDGYRIPRKTYFLNKQIRHGGWYPDYNLRLFRKGKGRFEKRAVHEAIKVDGRIGTAKHALLHYAYPDLAAYMTSINKYSSLSVKVMEEKGIIRAKAGWINIIFRPFASFILKYFCRLGFLDGKAGLVLNIFHSYYVFAKYAKAWEHLEKSGGH